MIDEPPQTAKDLVAENLTALDEAWKGKVLTEPDNAVIRGVIEQRIAARQTKSLILGSSWDKDLAQATDNILIYHSAPITDAAILNRTYVGYSGGLNLMQDIYTGVFDRHAVSNLTHGETSRERNTYRPAAGSNCN